MSAISATAALPPRGQHPRGCNPRRAKKEAPPEVIEYESRHQRRPSGPLAAPGSHGSAIGDARRDLRISSTPANPELAVIAQQDRTGLSLSKLSGNNPNNPEAHLWCVPPSAQGKNRRPAGTMMAPAAAGELKLPLQSPVRLVEWWRRPPSPIVSHVRSLWESTTGDDRQVTDTPSDMKKALGRAPEEEKEAVEEGRRLTSDGGSQQPKIKATPTEVSPEPEPEQEPPMTGTSAGPPFSALTPDSAGWSRLLRAAPPSPTTKAPTAAQAAAAAAAAAATQAPNAKDYGRQERSPSGSPESSRPGSMRWEGDNEEGAPPPPTGSPPRLGVHTAAATIDQKTVSRQSRPTQDRYAPGRGSLPESDRTSKVHGFGGGAAAEDGASGRQASSSKGCHLSRGVAASVGVNGRRASATVVGGSARRTLDARRLSLERKLSRRASGGDVVPEDAASTGPPPSIGDSAAPEGTVPSSRMHWRRSEQGAARRSAKPAPAAPVDLQATTGTDSDDNNGRGSPPPYLEGLAAGGSRGKSGERSQVNGGRGRHNSVVVLTKEDSRRGGGGGSLSGTLAAGLAVAISEMEKAENTRPAGRGGKRNGTAAGEEGDTSTGGADVGGGSEGGLLRSSRERFRGGRTSSPSRGRQATGAPSGEREKRDGGAAGGGGSGKGVVAEGDASQPSRLGYLSNGSSTMSISRESARATSHRAHAGAVTAKATVVDPSSSDESEEPAGNRRSSSSSSSSASTSYTAFSASTAVSEATAWTIQAPSEAAPPSTAGPATPDSLPASDANGPRSSLELSEGALGLHAAGAGGAAPPSPTSSHASSSLATSMKNPSRRRRRSGAASASKGTRPERETASSGGGSGAAIRSSHHLRRGYQRRRTPPSAESPLSVGAGSARAVAQNRRRPRMNASGMVGVPMQGMGGAGVTSGVGSSSGGVRLDDRGLRHMARGEDEAYERHYVNPMNARAGAMSSAAGFPEVPEDQKSKVNGGALAKLLRRLNVLRKRWRLKRKKDAEADGGDGGSGCGEAASSATSEAEDDDDVRRMPSARSTGGGQRGGPSEDKLEMACRRMLDALWMSAKRGTDTVNISVADGRTLLTGLVAARGDKDEGIDLGVPLPVVKGENASREGKPLRPVVGGASGPFARAGRGRDMSAGESDSGSHRRQAVALRRAMELAMGVSKERDTVRRTGSGPTKAKESAGSAGGFQSLADRSAATNRTGMGPSDSRHHARRSLTRAKLHRELRRESAAVGLTVGGAAGGDSSNHSDGTSSKAPSSVSSSRELTSNGYLHRANHHRRTGSDGSVGSSGSRGGASEASRVLRPGSSRPRASALAGTVAGVGGGDGDPPSSRGGYSDGESERSSRSLRPGSSSTRRASDASGAAAATMGGDREHLSRSRANARKSSRASDSLEVLRSAVGGGGRPVERFVDEPVSNRSRSRSSSRPAAVRRTAIGSAGSSRQGIDRGVRSNEGGFAAAGAADGVAGGPSSRIKVDRRDQNILGERRNHGLSAGARFDDRRRPRSQPLLKQG